MTVAILEDTTILFVKTTWTNLHYGEILVKMDSDSGFKNSEFFNLSMNFGLTGCDKHSSLLR